MELTYLKTFHEVAKWGSFTRAAETLGYAQSSITTQIQKLEESYGAVKVLQHNHVNYTLSYEFGNLEAIKQCVMYGLGIALLPRIVVADAVQKGELIAVRFAHPDCKFYTQLIYAKKKWKSKAFTGFLELVGGANHQN
ncbi:LysR substrate-binding domain-containing protein [Paenibacillus sp. TAF43_2]|uniref:LysR substrate-binding domain-containing protein n=1 Tax=Paenibacillus sp. TAF43_2 TaxID=3233069 RepID=UPI003F9507C9